MKTVFRLTLVILAVMMLSGCTISPWSENDTKSVEVINILPSGSLNELLNSKGKPLFIKKKGGEYYKSTSNLAAKIMDILKDSTQISGDSPDGQWIFADYDYRLRFGDFKDIMILLDRSAFQFEGEKEIYIINGDVRYKFDHLIKNRVDDMYIYSGIEEVEKISQREDLNNDGAEETLKIVYNGDYELVINNTRHTVLKNVADFTGSISPIDMDIINIRDGKTKLIAVPFTANANKIGQVIQLGLYEYSDGSIKNIWNTDDSIYPENSVSYDSGNKADVTIEGYGLIKDVKFPKETYESFIAEDNSKNGEEKDISLKEMLNGKDVLQPSTYTHYSIEDYDGDGWEDLVTGRMVYIPYRHLVFGRLYTVYKFANGRMECIHNEFK